MEKLKLNIPDGWQQVTVKMFQELAKLDNANDGIAKVVDLISVLADADPEDIRKVDSSELGRLMDLIKWTSQFPNNPHLNTITVKGIEYEMIKLSELSLGEWIDLDTYVEDSVINMHKIFATLYRTKEEKYDANKIEEKANMFADNLPIGEVYGALLFFSLIVNEYTKTLVDSLTEETTMEVMKMI